MSAYKNIIFRRLQRLFSGLNGLLLPGGSAPLTGPGGYATVGRLFYSMAVNSSRAGDLFPIWGTCNGFELLTVLAEEGVRHQLPLTSKPAKRTLQRTKAS